MKMVFSAVHMILHFPWNGKEVNLIYVANFLPWNLYVQKWNRNTILPTSQNVGCVTVIIHVPLLPEDECFIFIQDSFCIANRKTQNEKPLHADLLLARITQLVTVLVADKIHQHQYIRSLKPLIAWPLIFITFFLRSPSRKLFCHV